MAELVLVPLAGLLACGVAALALVPRGITARAMFAGGAMLVSAWVLEQAALVTTGVAGVLVRVGADTCFLLGLTALVVTLMCYPADGLSSRWRIGSPLCWGA